MPDTELDRPGGGDPEPIWVGRPRRFDDAFQTAALDYTTQMRQVLRLLGVRAPPEVKARLLAVPVRILNRGHIEAFVSGGTICVDIALLDLLTLFSFEQGVAELKKDDYHLMEFALSYAVALHAGASFEQLDPFNSANLSDAHFTHLWHQAKANQAVAFENTLAFILAHELGHLALSHDRALAAAKVRPDQGERWLAWRRQAEIDADQYGAVLSLDALFQPAQVVPWFTLAEIRRSYYGSAAEYPTPAQRERGVFAAYEARFHGTPEESQFSPVAPLPPDRDILKSDRARFLALVREVREFRRSFLFGLDTQVLALLNSGLTNAEAARFFVDTVSAWKDLLRGAPRPEALRQAQGFLDTLSSAEDPRVAELAALVGQVEFPPGTQEFLDGYLAQPVDLSGLRVALNLAAEPRPIHEEALRFRYLLTNTVFRWDKDLFEAIVAAVPGSDPRTKKLRALSLGDPVRQRPPFEERVQVLTQWDGKYG